MKERTLFFTVAGIILIGLMIGAVMTLYKEQETSPTEKNIPVSPSLPPETQVLVTFAPLVNTVASITSDAVVITGPHGDMTIPRNPAMVTVLRNVNGERIPASFEEITIGQTVTVNIIVPGKQAELIIGG